MARIGRPDQGTEKSSTDIHQLGKDRLASHYSFSTFTARCRWSEALHASLKTLNGCVSASRLGNTSSACPGMSWLRTCLANSRNRRLARFRRTALPNRRPTIIPTRADSPWTRQTKRLKNAVESRRPCCLTNSISRLLRKKSPLSPPSCAIDVILGTHSSTRVRRRSPATAADSNGSPCLGKPNGGQAASGTSMRAEQDAYTVKRARPLARRRAKTFRPFLVLIRLRNPCSRFFLRFDGCWDVKDMQSLLTLDKF